MDTKNIRYSHKLHRLAERFEAGLGVSLAEHLRNHQTSIKWIEWFDLYNFLRKVNPYTAYTHATFYTEDNGKDDPYEFLILMDEPSALTAVKKLYERQMKKVNN